ncbi:GNAT family N-acetyltransferase [Sandarakinorhabdus sp. AAP62]|uniref:GNAT family N-acetyltransferase n=1 Tax=Sandarakinorhabdus sp. AAP62 TaxID=1248916 RepID=UPI00187CDF43|nr:GNAT family N-acetyltransferase [Sandarakinorhabdus sp. AAP62]
MRPTAAIRPATLADRPAIIAVLAAAFIDDPALAWIFPDAARRPAQLTRFFGLITRADARLPLAQVALAGDGRIVGAALWRPPGAWALPTTSLIANLPRLALTFGTALPRTLGLMGAMDHQHDRRLHWYLQFIGVPPAGQGQGIGGALLRAGLAQAAGQPCYLETATPSNVGLYQANGFAVRNEWQHGSAPNFWSMWHEGERP